MMFPRSKLLGFFIFFVSGISTLMQANSLETAENSLRKHGKVPNVAQKNQILDAFKIRQVCMDVCNPPYYAQEYPNAYGNQFGQYSQYGQYYPSGGYGYGYGGYDGAQNYYPQNQYGEYKPWCYRDMFRKKYNIDPGSRQPRVFHYKKSIKEKSAVYRNYNYYQDYINCQRICYPMMIPDIITTVSTAKTKVTRPRTTKTTTTETSGSNEPPEVTEATLSPPEKPENNTTTSKTTVSATLASINSTFPPNVTNENIQSSTGISQPSVPIPQGSGKTKRKAEHWRKNKEEKRKIKTN